MALACNLVFGSLAVSAISRVCLRFSFIPTIHSDILLALRHEYASEGFVGPAFEETEYQRHRVYNILKSSNIRECVRIARLAKNDSAQVNRIIDTFTKYGGMTKAA
jgi:hypothetical protein